MYFIPLLLLVSIDLTLAQKCTDVNEQYTDCGTACPVTCANRTDTDRTCIESCVPGCFCKSDFVRNDQGKCLLISDCPVARKANLCKDLHETFTCGPVCTLTCENFANPPKDCIELDICDFGCFCDSPYVRDESTGKCVLSSDCPKTS